METFPESTRAIGAAVVYILAYGFAVALFAWMAKRRGLATSGVRLVVGAACCGGGIGAVLAQFAFGGTSGKTLLGGIAGGYLAVILMKRHLGLRRPLGDLFAVALAGGEAVGRWGCFIGGCCYGKMATVPWAVEDHGAFRHPTQLYSSFAAACTLAVLLALDRRGRLPENALFALQGALLCATRFVIEFYREPGATLGPLTVAQIACIGGFAFFATMLAAKLRTRTRFAARVPVAA